MFTNLKKKLNYFYAWKDIKITEKPVILMDEIFPKRKKKNSKELLDKRMRVKEIERKNLRTENNC